MNYLGHLLLTYPDTELTMGNLLGDMLTARQVSPLPVRLQDGVAAHHFIDRYTDAHQGIRQLVHLFRDSQGKYAPVVIDILLDHVLVHQWNEHAPISYPRFTQWVYRDAIPPYLWRFSDHLSGRLQGMINHHWLDGYGSVEGMHSVLARMDRRAAFPSHFIDAMEEYDRHKETFASVFRPFYSELKNILAREFAIHRPHGGNVRDK